MDYVALAAFMMAPRRRRNALLPIALPALANLPAAQAGALTVVTADAAIRHEQNTGDANATAAVAATIATAVSKKAELVPDDFKTNPIALQVVTTNPQILQPTDATQLSDAAKEEIVKLVMKELGSRHVFATGAKSGKPGSWTPAGSMPPATVADLTADKPTKVVASPRTAWKKGVYVQTGTKGANGRAHWDGTAWKPQPAP
jgi:hypothetical protein